MSTITNFFLQNTTPLEYYSNVVKETRRPFMLVHNNDQVSDPAFQDLQSKLVEVVVVVVR